MAASQPQGTGSAVFGLWQNLGGQSAQTPSAQTATAQQSDGATRVKVPLLILGNLVNAADCPPVRWEGARDTKNSVLSSQPLQGHSVLGEAPYDYSNTSLSEKGNDQPTNNTAIAPEGRQTMPKQCM